MQDGRGPGLKNSKDETANKKMEAERGFDNSRNISETEPSTSGISISNAGRESIVHEEFHEASSNYGYTAEVNGGDFLTIDTHHMLGSTCMLSAFTCIVWSRVINCEHIMNYNPLLL